MTEEVISLYVEDISCNHCVNTITKCVSDLNGVIDVAVSIDEKKVVVEFDNERVSSDIIKNIIEDQGYKVKQ